MRGRKFFIEWKEDESLFVQHMSLEKSAESKIRIKALLMLKHGKKLKDVGQELGIHYRTLQKWIYWYRKGGIKEVVKHKHGGRQGRAVRLTLDQQQRLLQKATSSGFETLSAAVDWVEQELGVKYTYWGLRKLFQRLSLGKHTDQKNSLNRQKI
ncbi:MAG: helix-turn-helix domain-containing protein [Blastocatellia bacterium]|nr:helix-turn-helix domain-containing protein [Blastocatellia bacterium]